MKIINLEPSNSTYLIQDNNQFYRLERVQSANYSGKHLVLTELDEEALTSAIKQCEEKH